MSKMKYIYTLAYNLSGMPLRQHHRLFARADPIQSSHIPKRPKYEQIGSLKDHRSYLYTVQMC